jgi:hypothetical protein
MDRLSLPGIEKPGKAMCLGLDRRRRIAGPPPAISYSA